MSSCFGCCHFVPLDASSTHTWEELESQSDTAEGLILNKQPAILGALNCKLKCGKLFYPHAVILIPPATFQQLLTSETDNENWHVAPLISRRLTRNQYQRRASTAYRPQNDPIPLLWSQNRPLRATGSFPNSKAAGIAVLCSSMNKM